MNRKLLPILGVAWLATLAVAFTIGRVSVPGVDETERELGKMRDLNKQLTLKSERLEDALADADEAPEAAPVAATDIPGELSRAQESVAMGDLPAGMQKLPRGEFRSALSNALADTDRLSRMAKLSVLIAQLSPDNIDIALAMLDDLPPGSDLGREMGMFVNAWARFDGMAAIAYVDENMDGRMSRWLKASAISGWATTDPYAAATYALENPEGDNSRFNPALMGLVSGWAESDPQAATLFLAELSPEERNGRMVGEVAERYLRDGVAAATRWAESIEDPTLRNEAIESVARDLSRSDPKAAAAWIEGMAADDSVADSVGRVARELARQDVASAVDWISDLPAGQSKSAASSAVIREWAGNDPTAAGEWLNEQPASPELDGAVQAYAGQIAQTDPALALDWASSIIDDGARQSSQIRIAQTWYRTEPEAALAFADEAGFSEEQKATITSPPNSGGRTFRR